MALSQGRRCSVDFRLLGSLEVADGELDVPIRGANQGALLALVLVHRGTTVRTDRLVEELWGDDVPNDIVNALQSLVSKLR